MNRFRLMEACPKQDFIDTTGLGLEAIATTIQWALEMGYLREDATQWQITEKGKLFLNDLLEAFMPDEE
ncbi:YggW family oxidoreductase, partial [Vibrio parahaemolyticus]|nr:YggW family oxidoreductase [Vibrio parahaemolyticus]